MGDLHGLPQVCLRPQPGPRQCPQRPSSAPSAVAPELSPVFHTRPPCPGPHALLSLPAAPEPVVRPGQGRLAARLPQPHLLLPSAGCSLASSPSSVIKTSRQRRGPAHSCLLQNQILVCPEVWLSSFLPAANQNHSEPSAACVACPPLAPPWCAHPASPQRWAYLQGALRSGEKWDFNIHPTFQRGRGRCVFQTNEPACGNSLKTEGWVRDS